MKVKICYKDNRKCGQISKFMELLQLEQRKFTKDFRAIAQF